MVASFTGTYRSFTRSLSSILAESYYNDEQREMQETMKKVIEKEINPYAEEWERDKMFPAHTVMKKLGEAGLLGTYSYTSFVVPTL